MSKIFNKSLKWLCMSFAFVCSMFIFGASQNTSALESLALNESMGFDLYSGEGVWYWGDDIYYSSASTHLVFNKETLKWEEKVWNGVPSNVGASSIWTDGTNYYWSNYSSQYVIDKDTSTWTTMTWKGDLPKPYGSSVWEHNGVYYHSYNGVTHKLEEDGVTWTSVSFVNSPTSLNANRIWTDGINTYYSYTNSQLIFDGDNLKWSNVSFNGLDKVDGMGIFNFDGEVYYPLSSTRILYKFNVDTNTWEENPINGFDKIQAKYIWTDGIKCYMTMSYVTWEFDYVKEVGAYTESDLENSYNQGVEDGKASVDITSDNEEYVNQKIQNGELWTIENVQAMGEYLEQVCDDFETKWDNLLRLINEKISFTDEDIIHLMEETSFITTPEEKEIYYNNLILGRWEEYVNEVKASVDITLDNQEYVNKYIEDNNYHTDEEYLEYGETMKQVGIDSVDITTDNQEYADKYIKDNNYRTYQAFINYGNQMKQVGIDSVDITLDNQEYANKYIKDNNYHTNEEYLEYGETMKQVGIDSVDITIDNEEYGNKRYKQGYKDNSIKTHVGSFFDKIGDLLFGWLIK